MEDGDSYKEEIDKQEENSFGKELFSDAIKNRSKINDDGTLSLVGIKDEVKITKDIEKKVISIFGVIGQVQQLYEAKPFFYNKSGMFLIWDNENKKYEVSDEVDMLNGIAEIGADTINSKTKSEILNAIKQYGRKKVPLEAPKTWVQFKDKIYDYKTGEEFDASPKYFITNPIPHNVGESEDTPTIDHLFLQWVGKDYCESLHQVTAYTTSSYQFMQRIIALIGGGSNGKGTFLKLLIRFLGNENTTSSEIKELSNNQFETAVIYKKLLCVVGEVSHDDMKNTNQLKKLGGEDPIRYCFKGKTPFTEDSPTTVIPATNSLPKTPDKTMGFYRKWFLIDFPNQFTEIKHGIVENIPEVEFENLSKKTLRILTELYKSQKFINEGTFEERMKRYEERSNPVLRFIETNCEENVWENTELKKFTDAYNEHAKVNHLRVMSVIQIGKVLREEGFETGRRTKDLGGGNKSTSVFVINVTLKNTQTTQTTENPSRLLRETTTSNLGSSSSLSNLNKELPI